MKVVINLEQAQKNIYEIVLAIEKSRMLFNEHHIVQTVAISKYSSVGDVLVLFEAGQRAFGENKVQELKDKQNKLKDLPIQWHFVGKLQSNKINALLQCDIFLFHSLDSYELALKLDKKLKAKDIKLNALLQINISNSTTQQGISKKETINIFDKITKTCTNINLKGLMCIGANSQDKKEIQKCFLDMKILFDKCKKQYPKINILSCGMSGDYKIAIASGANMIRIGRDIFKID